MGPLGCAPRATVEAMTKRHRKNVEIMEGMESLRDGRTMEVMEGMESSRDGRTMEGMERMERMEREDGKSRATVTGTP